MMRRNDLHALVQADEEGVVMHHYFRAVRLRARFMGLAREGGEEGQVWMPSCHAVARAYAQAYGVQYADGEHVYVQRKSETRFRKKPLFHLMTYVHSWNIIEVKDGVSAILDIFPDVGAPMMPVLLQNPHPAYVLPQDELFARRVRDVLARPDFEKEVALLSEEFLRLEKKDD